MQRAPGILGNATQFFSSTASRLIPVGSNNRRPSRSNTNDIGDFGDFDLRDDEVMEEERGEEGDVDDSVENRRDVRVLSLPLTLDEDGVNGGSRMARNRRRWEIVPLLRERAKQVS
jgi:hypothetical protein